MNLAGGEGGESEKIELQMTSMIDCVFLLLIFFVMTMKFPKVEGNLPAHLPREGRKSSDQKEQTEEIVIGLEYPNKQLIILVNGANIGNRMDALRTKLFLLRRQIPDARVTVDGAPAVPYEYIVRTLNACAKFGFQKIQFAQPREDV